MKNNCAVCNISYTTRAHVKDKSFLVKEGVSNHDYLNIIDLCYNCHYNYFDRGKLGLKKIDNWYYFFRLEDDGSVSETKSFNNLNVMDEYISWKNKKLNYKLLRLVLG